MDKISVLLADDYAFIREGLRALLEAEGDIVVVGEAETGSEAVRLARQLLPEVVIMDLAMPVLSGVEATRQIKRLLPEIRVLALCSCNDDKFVHQMIAAGATGYLLKQASVIEVIKAVREAKKGRSFFSPAIASRLEVNTQENLPNGTPPARGIQKLTRREIEVLQLVAEGYATKQIAGELHSSVGTVVKQRQQVMNKLNLHNIAALTRYAVSEGMLKVVPRRDQAAVAVSTLMPLPGRTTIMTSLPNQIGLLPSFNLVAPPAAVFPARCND